ncbi:GatB/YqeY domain-containing protein [uncultured Mucilaginibacter sp.]|uniref:GatB/YqeY domain-containing protein n=1 Tax=uncultured Mucilaginibacter sp. TaxID=797541 RepID=UPI0025F71F10|nr:GatB/YqeY domain-containing protein [uncultured Mucilaginibacter sp.]
MSLINQVDQDIKQAMLAKQPDRLRGLRAIKSALLLARTEKGAAEELTEEAEIKVLQKLIKQRKESADIYKAQNREDLYEIEMEEMRVIEPYLPKQMSTEEVEVFLKGLISRVGAVSVKDMGKVMGAANKELAGKADGRTISEVVKKLLGS